MVKGDLNERMCRAGWVRGWWGGVGWGGMEEEGGRGGEGVRERERERWGEGGEGREGGRERTLLSKSTHISVTISSRDLPPPPPPRGWVSRIVSNRSVAWREKG